MLSTIEIRQNFLNYFRKNKHKYMPPSKVYNDDPTLFFVNAGMNQLKDVFLGQREMDEKFNQLMNSQICVRAGGKHNDLDDVGFDSYHLTSFEMLGQWSINSYQKKEAIRLAYTYLIEECGLNSDQMYATYFEGCDEIPEDTETKEFWREHLPESHILPGNFKDNFWMMADTGPCGACTEIHYDTVGGRNALELVNKDDPKVIEIWNNVFIQYNKTADKYEPLDKFYVDTGMGLERLSMVMHDHSSLYQTDALRYLIGYAQVLTHGPYFTDKYDGGKTMSDVAYRIFADHIRTTVNALFDGVEFGCHEREFILKKIFRRALTYSYLYLCGYVISPMMGHPAVRCMISDVLAYYLKKKNDSDEIWKKLIEEEMTFIGKIRFVKRKYQSYIKRKSHEEVRLFLHDNHGIPNEITDNLEKIIFKDV